MFRKILIGITAITTVLSAMCLTSCGDTSTEAKDDEEKVTKSISEAKDDEESKNDKEDSEKNAANSISDTANGEESQSGNKDSSVNLEDGVISGSMLNYTKKAKLKTANTNAKCVYNAISVVLDDEECKGNIVKDTIEFETKISDIEEKEDTKTIEDAVKNSVKKALSGEDVGYAYVKILPSENSDNYSPYNIYVQWKNDNGEFIGQYPDVPESIEASENLSWGNYNYDINND